MPNICDMSPQEIRIALMRAKVSQAKIAKQLGVHPSAVTRVIDGTTVSHRIRSAIAHAAGIDIKRMWPSAYLYGSPPKPGRPKTT